MKSLSIVIPTLGLRPEWLVLAAASAVESLNGEGVLVVVAPPSRVNDVRQTLLSSGIHSATVLGQSGYGPASAIEEGWAYNPSTDFVTWIGDDDVLQPTAFRLALRIIEQNSDRAFIYGRVIYISSDGSMLFERRPGRFATQLLKHGFNQIAQPGAIYRRRAIMEVGGLDTNLKYAFDLDLHLKLCTKFKASYLPHVLALYRSHPDSLTVGGAALSRHEAKMIFESRLGSSFWQMLIRPIYGFLGKANYKIGTVHVKGL